VTKHAGIAHSATSADTLSARFLDSPMAKDIARVLITEHEIQARIAELGAQISADYRDKAPVLVGVLRGVFIFMADLVRHITIPISVDFIGITRYGPSTRTHGVVRFVKDLDIYIENRHVLFVEDVIDTGLSLRYILSSLETRQPASLRICTLFNKPRIRLFDLDVAYTGFVLPDKFVVGYGLDYDERYRNLPFVGELNDSAITQQRLPSSPRSQEHRDEPVHHQE
jgi:hypoxanthine phosphoribosyltransferase